MQRVQELILNPETRALTVFPFSGMLSSNNISHSTVIPQPWLQQQSGSDSGKHLLKISFNLVLIFIFLKS